ncbi:MAG: SpaH/EbpB family LPXTG-anchored major pilin [Clostridia bacterium]|nr:SpaH/EbpB family LPXTG-anchored major pilin [Clostridia bacterium]
MYKLNSLRKVISVIIVLVFGLMAVPQVLTAEGTEIYALKGTIGSLKTIVGDEVPWPTETSGTIKIRPKGSPAGAAYSAYKLLNIVNDSGMLKVSVPDKAQPFWKEYLSQSTDVTVADIKTTIKNMDATTASSSIVNAFLDFSENASEIDMPEKMPPAQVEGTDATISTTFGFYIILQTAAPANGYIASAPVLACLPMQNVDTGKWLSSYVAEPKDDTIKISKKVKATGDVDYLPETITEIGDTVEYEIVIDLAKYGSDVTRQAIKYLLVDELPAGLEYINNSATVIFYKGGTVDTPTRTYEAKYDTDTRKLKLDLGTDYATKLADFDTAVLTYKAILGSSAVIEGNGNDNNAVLEYTSAVGKTSTYSSVATVYTHELDITKVDDKNPANHLSGAVFQVYKDPAHKDDSSKAIPFIDVSSPTDKIYRVATEAEKSNTEIDKFYNLAVSDTGKMKIIGLNDTDYYFKETVAPVGYNLPEDLFTISPAPEPSEITTNDEGEKLYVNMVAQSATIKNNSGINLPVTGGMGTILFTAVGLLLMAGAAYFLFAKKKGSH